MRFLSVQTCKVCVDPAFQGKSAIIFCKNFFIQGDCQVSNNGFDCFCMWHSELSCEPSNLTLCKCNARTSDIWCVQQHLNCTFAISCWLIPQFYSSGLDPSSACHLISILSSSWWLQWSFQLNPFESCFFTHKVNLQHQFQDIQWNHPQFSDQILQYSVVWQNLNIRLTRSRSNVSIINAWCHEQTWLMKQTLIVWTFVKS